MISQAVFEKLVDEICARLSEMTESSSANGTENGIKLEADKEDEASGGGCSCWT